MTKAEILEKLQQIIQDRLDVEKDQIVPGASFVEDLGADSLDIVELIMGIEEEFDVTVDSDVASKVTTVGQALELIKNATEE